MALRKRKPENTPKAALDRGLAAAQDGRGRGGVEDAAVEAAPDEVAAFNWPSVQVALGIFVYGNYLTGPASLYYVSRTLLSLGASFVVSGGGGSFPEAWTLGRGLWWWCVGESALLVLFFMRLVRWQARADWTPATIGVPTKQLRQEVWAKMMRSLPDSPHGPAVQWVSDW